MATQLENRVKPRLESEVFLFLTSPVLISQLLCVCEYICLCVYIYKHKHTYMCVCVCIYIYIHTRLVNFLSSSTSARVETEPAWCPVNSQCWEQHLTHNWSSINIYWTLINTYWTEGLHPCRAGMSHLLSFFSHFLTLFNELLSQLDCQFWWQPLSALWPFRMDLYLIRTLPLADRFENKSFSKHQLSIEFVQAAV